MSNKQNNSENEETAVAERKPTVSQRFTNEVKRQLSAALSQQVDFTEHQQQLMTNMFIKIDSALEEHEARRQKRNKNNQTPYTWENVDMQKLALDAMHRIRLGLDALVDNHLHPIPYFNSKTKKYDLNLMIGYKGKMYYRQKVSMHDVEDVRIELVHKNDEFEIIKQGSDVEVEKYNFRVPSPWDRGDVIGGFGYIIYEDETRNKVVTVTKDDFDKSKDAAQSNKFWGKWEERMQKKTLSHRVAEEIKIDPRKVNQSFHYVEAQENPYKDDMEVTLDQPRQEDRKNIDIDMDQGNGQQAEDVDVEEESAGSGKKPSTERRNSAENSTERNNGGESSTDQEQKDRLIKQVNELGKELHGTNWYKESKVYAYNLNETAENLLDLNIGELEEIENQLEYKLEKQNAKAEA